MKTQILILLLVITGITVPAQDIDLAVTAIPPKLFPAANAVLRWEETTLEIENASEFTLTSHWIVTILNKEGERYNTASCYETDFGKVKKIEGVLYDAAGEQIKKTKKSDILSFGGASEYEYSGNRNKYVELEYPTYPYTVEFTTVESVKGFFRIPRFTVNQLGEAVQQSSFKVVVPKDYRFKWKGIHTDVQPEQQTAKNGTNTYTWHFEGIAAPKMEPQTPFFGSSYTEILLAPENIEIDDYKGNFSDWKSVSRFFYELNKGRDQISPEMKQEVAKITANAANNREKVALLYHYLQDNYRYVSIQLGIGGWQTLDAAFVERQKYGDCKALSNYMKTLLDAAGIPSCQVIVFASRDGKFPVLDPTFPIPYFNHVILYVPGEDLWLECTSNTSPMGYLSNFTAGHQALPLVPEGSDLVTVPVLDETMSSRHNTAVLKIAETGDALVTIAITGRGIYQDYYRNLSLEKDPVKKEKDFTSGYPLAISLVNKLDCSASSTLPEAVLTAGLDIRNYAKKTGKRLFVPLTGLYPLQLSLPEDKSRQHPLFDSDAYTLLDTFQIDYPEGFIVENASEAYEYQSVAGTYAMHIKKEQGRLLVTRKYVAHPYEVPAEEYDTIRKFFLDISKAEKSVAVLVKQE